MFGLILADITRGFVGAPTKFFWVMRYFKKTPKTCVLILVALLSLIGGSYLSSLESFSIGERVIVAGVLVLTTTAFNSLYYIFDHIKMKLNRNAVETYTFSPTTYATPKRVTVFAELVSWANFLAGVSSGTTLAVCFIMLLIK